jgi:hypothetical protein
MLGEMRPSFLRPTLLLVLGAVSLSACGGEEKSDAEAFVADYCGLLAPCCVQAGKSGDMTACQQFLGFATAGRAFNKAAGDQCLAASRAAAQKPTFCSDGGSDDTADAACEGVFGSAPRGASNVPPGGTCELDEDCAAPAMGDARCATHFDTSGPNGTSTHRTCQVLVAGVEGGPCDGTRDGSGYIISGSDEKNEAVLCDKKQGLICEYASMMCVAVQPAGGSCTSSDACDEATRCDYSTGKCEPRDPIGATCSSTGTDKCVKEAYCDGVTHVCTPVKEVGAACSGSDECGDGFCNNGKCEGSNFAIALLCGS